MAVGGKYEYLAVALQRLWESHERRSLREAFKACKELEDSAYSPVRHLSHSGGSGNRFSFASPARGVGAGGAGANAYGASSPVRGPTGGGFGARQPSSRLDTRAGASAAMRSPASWQGGGRSPTRSSSAAAPSAVHSNWEIGFQTVADVVASRKRHGLRCWINYTRRKRLQDFEATVLQALRAPLAPQAPLAPTPAPAPEPPPAPELPPAPAPAPTLAPAASPQRRASTGSLHTSLHPQHGVGHSSTSSLLSTADASRPSPPSAAMSSSLGAMQRGQAARPALHEPDAQPPTPSASSVSMPSFDVPSPCNSARGQAAPQQHRSPSADATAGPRRPLPKQLSGSRYCPASLRARQKERVARQLERTRGRGHPEVVRAFLSLAEHHEESGFEGERKRTLEHVLFMQEESHLLDTYDASLHISTLVNLAVLHKRRGDAVAEHLLMQRKNALENRPVVEQSATAVRALPQSGTQAQPCNQREEELAERCRLLEEQVAKLQSDVPEAGDERSASKVASLPVEDVASGKSTHSAPLKGETLMKELQTDQARVEEIIKLAGVLWDSGVLRVGVRRPPVLKTSLALRLAERCCRTFLREALQLWWRRSSLQKSVEELTGLVAGCGAREAAATNGAVTQPLAVATHGPREMASSAPPSVAFSERTAPESAYTAGPSQAEHLEMLQRLEQQRAERDAAKEENAVLLAELASLRAACEVSELALEDKTGAEARALQAEEASEQAQQECLLLREQLRAAEAAAAEAAKQQAAAAEAAAAAAEARQVVHQGAPMPAHPGRHAAGQAAAQHPQQHQLHEAARPSATFRSNTADPNSGAGAADAANAGGGDHGQAMFRRSSARDLSAEAAAGAPVRTPERSNQAHSGLATGAAANTRPPGGATPGSTPGDSTARLLAEIGVGDDSSMSMDNDAALDALAAAVAPPFASNSRAEAPPAAAPKNTRDAELADLLGVDDDDDDGLDESADGSLPGL